MRIRVERLAFAATIVLLSKIGVSQQSNIKPNDPFQEHVAGIELKEQSVIDGIAMLSHAGNFAVSVEYPLGKTISEPAPQLKIVTATIGPGTVAEVLDKLCALDTTFIWTKDGNMLNVLPRNLAHEPGYLLNRTVGEVAFQDIQTANDTVMKLVDQLPGPREQVAVLQVGPPLNFAQTWTITLKNITVRQVFDTTARQLGPTFGWQFSGAQDFRIITFHEGLLPTPSRTKQSQARTEGN